MKKHSIFYHPQLMPTPLHVMLFAGYNFAPSSHAALVDAQAAELAGMIRDLDAAEGTGMSISLIEDAIGEPYRGPIDGEDYPVSLAMHLLSSTAAQNLLRDTRRGYRSLTRTEIAGALIPLDTDALTYDVPENEREMPVYADPTEVRTLTHAEVTDLVATCTLRSLCEALNRYTEETL